MRGFISTFGNTPRIFISLPYGDGTFNIDTHDIEGGGFQVASSVPSKIVAELITDTLNQLAEDCGCLEVSAVIHLR